MKKEVLQFYLDNDLNEVISEKKQNYFLQKEIIKKSLETKKVEVKKTIEKPAEKPIIKPIFSTSEALGQLAKKTQNMTSSSQEFQPLNDIIAKAKKLAQNCKNLDELKKAVENFDGCNLKKMATNTVFCDGNPNSKVMVIGEAPGNHEDLQGIPFCGDSGKLLDDMLKSINLSRKEGFYISNVIFWRPPGNRRPTDEELAICKPFVERHIQLINPEILVLVGSTSMSAVLGINDPVSSIRGKFMDFSPNFLNKTIKTFTIFHPSYLMRQPSKKKIAWQDMLALEKAIS
jgi:uracil-DNA glycosylase family 4